MEKLERDEEREARIEMEAIVDAYDSEEQAMGWYYYLEDKITFPFKAQCNYERTTSPLQKGEKVKVTGMAPEDDCMCDMFVMINWMNRILGVPLVQLKPLRIDEESEEAIADWHYWVGRGYQLLGLV